MSATRLFLFGLTDCNCSDLAMDRSEKCDSTLAHNTSTSLMSPAVILIVFVASDSAESESDDSTAVCDVCQTCQVWT